MTLALVKQHWTHKQWGCTWGLTRFGGWSTVLETDSTFVPRNPYWDAQIQPPNLGTWAAGELVVQPTAPSRTVSVVITSSLRRGHLLMARENIKGW